MSALKDACAVCSKPMSVRQFLCRMADGKLVHLGCWGKDQRRKLTPGASS